MWLSEQGVHGGGRGHSGKHSKAVWARAVKAASQGEGGKTSGMVSYCHFTVSQYYIDGVR